MNQDNITKGVTMTKIQYKKVRREYRIAFNSKTYDAFWSNVKSSEFDLIDRIAKTVHDKDYVFFNKLKLKEIWGF